MTDGKKLGLSEALAIVGTANTVPGAVAEQLPLLPISKDHGEGAPVGEDDDGARGPGRPPGSRNKRTQEMADYLMSRYRSPLVILCETYSRPVALLAAELSCSLADAFDFQLKAAKEVALYVHQKMPVAIDVDADGVISLQVVVGDKIAGEMIPGDDALVIDADVLNTPADQIKNPFRSDS